MEVVGDEIVAVGEAGDGVAERVDNGAGERDAPAWGDIRTVAGDDNHAIGRSEERVGNEERVGMDDEAASVRRRLMETDDVAGDRAAGPMRIEKRLGAEGRVGGAEEKEKNEGEREKRARVIDAGATETDDDGGGGERETD